MVINEVAAVRDRKDMGFSGLLLCFQLMEGGEARKYSESRNQAVPKDEISARGPKIYYQGTKPKTLKWHSDWASGFLDW
jgi:hypothetical protein